MSVNGVRLAYREWAGDGPLLILIPGLGESPHVFDDLAPAFSDRFRVIAYARRGTHPSEARPPYDAPTLRDDLSALMAGIGVSRADVAGWSMGGTEATALAAAFPERVDRIVYLDSFDLAVPEFDELTSAAPPGAFTIPSEVLASADAYRTYMLARHFSRVDPVRVDAYLRAQFTTQSDGRSQRGTPPNVEDALGATMRSGRRPYQDVRSPALAIFARSTARLPGVDASHQERYARALDRFRSAAIARMRGELPEVEVLTVAGTHKGFFFESRTEVVAAMRRFLGAPPPNG